MIKARAITRKPKHRRRKVIFVDVDDTLIINGRVNVALVEWIKGKHDDGYYTGLWSSRGRVHAEKAASRAGLSQVFDIIIPKPAYIVDDKGWGWISYTQTIDPKRIKKELSV